MNNELDTIIDGLKIAVAASMKRNSYDTKTAILRVLPSLVGRLTNWEIEASLEVSARIADDVNAHEEAADIRKLINR